MQPSYVDQLRRMCRCRRCAECPVQKADGLANGVYEDAGPALPSWVIGTDIVVADSKLTVSLHDSHIAQCLKYHGRTRRVGRSVVGLLLQGIILEGRCPQRMGLMHGEASQTFVRYR